MTASRIGFVFVVLCLLAGCAASPAPSGGEARGASRKADGETFDESLVEAPPVVVVLVDEATLAWAASEPSRRDVEPIEADGASPQRFREVFARVLAKLSEGDARPAAVALDYYFPPAAAGLEDVTLGLADAVIGAGFPVSLGIGPGELDPSLYEPGAFDGHLRAVPLAGNGWKMIPLTHGVGGEVLSAPPLAVAAAAAWATGQRDDPDRESARAASIDQAFELALSLSFRQPMPIAVHDGVEPIADLMPVRRHEGVETVSMRAILEGDPDVAARLAGAVVFIGDGVGDQHDILGDRVALPGVYAHAWTARFLIEKMIESASEAAPAEAAE